MMSNGPFQVELAAHPLLRPAAFTAQFKEPLGRTETPAWVMDLLRLDADVPFERDEDLFGKAV